MSENKPHIVDHDNPEPMKKRRNGKRFKNATLDELKDIYNDGEALDMTRIDRKRKSPRATLVGLILFFAILAGAAWAGFFVFKPYARFEGNGIALAINGPKEVKAGEVITYQFTYQNTERVGLAALELRLVVPDEFQLLESSVEPTSRPYTWTLGALARDGEGNIELRGFFLGPDEGRSAFQSIATYRPANFNADFQAITTKPIAIDGSVLEATIVAPTEVAPGEKFEYQYTLKHTGTEKLENLELSLEDGDAFLFESAEPAPTEERPLRFAIPPLEAGAETVVAIRGSFAATAKGSTEVPFVIGVLRDDTLLTHRRDLATTDVLAGDLALKLIINGATTDFPTDYGDTLRTSLSYENQGERTIGDLTLSLRITASPDGLVNWDDAIIAPEGRIRDGVITWTPRELDALGRVKPGDEGTIDISLPIVATPPETPGAHELRFSGVALLSTINGRVVARQVETAPITVALNADLTVNAGAVYFDERDVAVGSGPLPPEVGSRTQAQIFFDITNTRHDLENVRIRTALPALVDWIGRTRSDTGSISWGEASRTVTFSVGRLAAGETVTADFDVAFTPAAEAIGTFVPLTDEITAAARDTVTSTALSLTLPALTSESLTDAAGTSRGVVVE